MCILASRSDSACSLSTSEILVSELAEEKWESVMEKRWSILYVLLALSWMILGAGCSKNSTAPVGETTDQDALIQVMNDDQELESVNVWEGDDDAALGGPHLDDVINPIHWGRVGRMVNSSFTVSIQGDTLATITRTVHFNGQLRILTDTTGGTRTVLTKPMFNVLVRKAHARRVARTPYRPANWRVFEVTPEVMLSAAPNPNTVHPSQVQIYKITGGGTELVATVTNPLDTYFNRDTLPGFSAGDSVLVTATPIGSADSTVAVLHPHVFREGRQPRMLMTDHNGGFEKSYVIGPRPGLHVVGVDMINRATLYDSEVPYNAGGWALPYRVIPQDSVAS
jgi:hypothetical protein